MKISIIVPVINESALIPNLVSYLWAHAGGAVAEIIVSDGGSTDNTIAVAAAAGALVVVSPAKGRAFQMNYGARFATGDLFYFVHADTLPPTSFAVDLVKAVSNGYSIGRYTTRFDGNQPLLKLNAFFTRFDWFVCYGGDQTLFITRAVFKQLKGYDESLLIMEEYELTERARQLGKYIILPATALVSSRKYKANSWWRVQRANYLVVKMYRQGASQAELVKTYQRLLRPV